MLEVVLLCVEVVVVCVLLVVDAVLELVELEVVDVVVVTTSSY